MPRDDVRLCQYKTFPLLLNGEQAADSYPIVGPARGVGVGTSEFGHDPLVFPAMLECDIRNLVDLKMESSQFSLCC